MDSGQYSTLMDALKDIPDPRKRRGKRHAAYQGDVSVLTSAPYGYRYVRKQEGGGQAQVLIDFDEAAIVQQIFSWVGRDKLTIGAARRRLLEAGIATRTGKRVWNHKTLWDMLANPAYKGEAAVGFDAQCRAWSPLTSSTWE